MYTIIITISFNFHIFFYGSQVVYESHPLFVVVDCPFHDAHPSFIFLCIVCLQLFSFPFGLLVLPTFSSILQRMALLPTSDVPVFLFCLVLQHTHAYYLGKVILGIYFVHLYLKIIVKQITVLNHSSLTNNTPHVMFGLFFICVLCTQ